jgi:hypothetical protein
MKKVLSIIPDMAGVRSFLDGLEPHEPWDGIELPSDILGQGARTDRVLSSIRLPLACARDVLPVNVSRYMAEEPSHTRQELVAHARRQLEKASGHSFHYASLDVGLERVRGNDWRAALDARMSVLKTVLPIAARGDITVCLPQRLPAGPAGVRSAIEVAGELKHDSCRVQLDVFPDELPDAAAVEAALSALDDALLAVVRFHFEPELRVCMDPHHHEAWAAALRQRAFKGAVVFCPSASGIGHLRHACAELAEQLRQHWR